MTILFFKSAVLALISSRLIQAHTVFTTLYVNGQSQGKGTCVRSSTDGDRTDWPVMDVNSDAMACNVGGQSGVSRTCPVPDGARVTFEYRMHPWDLDTSAIQAEHYGPCAVYMKKVGRATESRGSGGGWFKLWHDGYDAEEKLWCTNKLRKNNGYLSVDLPKGLKGGDYLLRPEVLSVHAATIGQPQFFLGCAQIFLESDGTLVPDETVSIPGHIEPGEPSITINIWNKTYDGDYELAGPSVLTGFSPSDGKGPPEQTDGLRPDDCFLEVANFCAREFPEPSTVDECWDTKRACMKEWERCYSELTSSFSRGCREIASLKCDKFDETCKENPSIPDKGIDLTPKPKQIDLPAPYPGAGSKDSTPCCQPDKTW